VISLNPGAGRKVKIVRIIARMNVGGPAIQISTIMKGLPEGEFEQLLLTGNCGTDELDYLDLHKIYLPKFDIPSFGRSINFLADLRALLLIRRQIVDFAPDIIHTHTFKAGVLGRIASLTIRSRVIRIHTFHGHLLQGYLKGFKLLILLQIERFLAARTDVLVCVGHRVMEELLSKGIGNREQYRIIPPGFPIDSATERDALPRAKSDREIEFKTAWVGRIVDVKKPERVLEIAKRLQEQKSNVRIFVVGDGPLRESLERRSRSEDLPISFMGWQSDIHKILTEVDVLFLTSANEGTPISIIEAQRLGRPVIATDVGSVSEVMIPNESGFILDYNSEAFAEKLELLAKNEELFIRLSFKAKEFASNRFSSERLVNNHIELYRDSIRRAK